MEDIRKKMYIKVYYSMIDWEWFHEPNTFVVFIHLLLHANRKPQKYFGDVINRGEVLASLEFLAKDTGLSIQNVRTALKNLKSTQDITQRKIGKTAVYTIVSYDKWQSANTIPNNELTSNQHRTNNELTTPIDCKNERMRDCKSVCVKENDAAAKKSTHTYGKYRNIFLTEEEYRSFLSRNTANGQTIIDQLSEKIVLEPD